MKLDEESKRFFISFHDSVEKALVEGGDLYPIRGLAAKAAEHAARIAAILALFQNPLSREIKLDLIQAGVRLMRYYVDESLRLFDSGSIDRDIQIAEDLLEWLRDRENNPISLVEIYQRGPRPIRSAEAARKFMRILMQHGKAMVAPDGIDFDGAKRNEAFWIKR